MRSPTTSATGVPQPPILAMVVSRHSTLTTDYESSSAMVTPASQAENASSILVARSTLDLLATID
jgi:hypothetical protein